MIQAYKNRLQYWIATRLGSMETEQEDHIIEILCPDCRMPTPLDSTKQSEQSCYFCNGDLISNKNKSSPVQANSVHNNSKSPAPTTKNMHSPRQTVKQKN